MNTAAREVALPELPMQWKSEAPGTCLYTAEQMHLYAIAAINLTLSPTGDGWTPQLMDELLACMDGWSLILGERSVRHGDTWAWEMKDAAALIRALRTKQPAASEGDGHYCNPVAFFNATAYPECVNKHYLPTGNTSKQEAREFLARQYDVEDPDYAADLRDAEVAFDFYNEGDVKAIRAITAALRSKAAASEGDGRVDLQQFRPAVVNWRNEQRGTIKQLEDSVSQLGSGIQKLAEDRLREADRLLAIIDNTSKQAAGEAVDEASDRAAFIAWLEADDRLDMMQANYAWRGWRANSKQRTTPPRHPADGAT